MICYKKWLDHEYKRLDNSQAGVYVNGIIHRKASFLYDEIQKSQLEQLRFNMPYDPYTDEPFIELLTAAHNGVFFLPTDLSTRMVENIEKIEVNGNFQLTEKERTVVDAIGPYGIRYQGEQILSNQPWLSEHAKNPEFRFAVMLKLAQMVMNANTDWYYQMRRYDARPFVSVPKAMELE